MRAGVVALVAVAAAGAASVAVADPTAMVRAPAGWRADAERAAEVTAAAGKHDGVVAIEAYVPDGGGRGAALFVTRVTTPGVHDASGAVDDFHAVVRRDRLTSTTVVEDSFRSHVDGAVTVAELASHDPAIHLARASRLVARVDADRLVAVTGECLLRDDLAPDVAAACKAALATLEPGAGAASPPGPLPAAATAPDSVAPSSAPPAVMRPLDPAKDAPMMPPVEVATPESSERWRPLVFGAGLVLLAGLFLANRRRRQDLATQATEPPEGTTERDDDADALRAAARGDSPDDRGEGERKP
jgi:hypothetical protein